MESALKKLTQDLDGAPTSAPVPWEFRQKETENTEKEPQNQESAKNDQQKRTTTEVVHPTSLLSLAPGQKPVELKDSGQTAQPHSLPRSHFGPQSSNSNSNSSLSSSAQSSMPGSISAPSFVPLPMREPTAEEEYDPLETSLPMKSGSGRWTSAEDESLREAVRKVGPRNWKRIASEFMANTRTDVQCLHRWQKVLRPGLIKGPFRPEEDEMIKNCVAQGMTRWSDIARYVPGRLGKQCRERWFNHLNPNLNHGEWTEAEDVLLMKGHELLGNKWAEIAKKFLSDRSENAIKNRFHARNRRVTQSNGKNGAARTYNRRTIQQQSSSSNLDTLTQAASKSPRAKTKRVSPKKKLATPSRRSKRSSNQEEAAIGSLQSLITVALDYDKKDGNDFDKEEKAEHKKQSALVHDGSGGVQNSDDADATSAMAALSRSVRGASFAASRPNLSAPSSLNTSAEPGTSATPEDKHHDTDSMATPLIRKSHNGDNNAISPSKVIAVSTSEIGTGDLEPAAKRQKTNE